MPAVYSLTILDTILYSTSNVPNNLPQVISLLFWAIVEIIRLQANSGRVILNKKKCKTHYSRERLQFSSMLLQVQETQCQVANLNKQVLLVNTCHS